MTADRNMPNYPVEAPRDLWEKWKVTVPRSYDRLGDRIVELLEADLEAHQSHGKGLVELARDEGLIEETDSRAEE